MDYVVKAGEKRDNFISTGFPRLDGILGGGFIRGGLYILGARPAVGKSTFALNLADGIAGNLLFVSLEMSPEQILAKRVSHLTGYTASKLLSGQLPDKAWEAVAIATTSIDKSGVYINSRYDLTVQEIHLLAQSVPELRCIILDYLGLIQPATRSGSTYEQVYSACEREWNMDKNIVAAFLGAYNMAIRGELGERLRDTMPPERKQELIRYIVEDKPATKQQKEAFL